MIYIIGISDDGLEGLSSVAVAKLKQADLIIGPASLLDKAAAFPARKEVIGGDLEKLSLMLEKESTSEVVVLAGGDPLSTVLLGFSAIDSARIDLKSSRTLVRCNWPLLASRKAGKKPT